MVRYLTESVNVKVIVVNYVDSGKYFIRREPIVQ